MFPAEASNTFTTTPASSGPDLSKALGSEDDEFYMEDTMAMNGLYHGHLSTADSDGSFASFYYNSPVQTPVQKHPARLSSLLSTGPSEFYAGPVRGAGYYSIKTDTQQGEQF